MDDKCVSLGPFVERTSKYYAEGPGLSSEVGKMEMLDKGVLLRTIEVTDPKARFKRNYLWFISIGPTIVIILMLIFLWYLGMALEVLALVAVLCFTMEIISDLVMFWTLGRSLWPISIYSNGIEFHRFLFDRLRRVPGFIEKSDITEVRLGAGGLGLIYLTATGTAITVFSLRTRNGRRFWSGERLADDAKAAVELIGKWGVNVFELDTPGR